MSHPPKKHRTASGVPDTVDWSEKYDHLRDEYKTEEDVKRGQEYIDEFVRLYRNPGNKSKTWDNFLVKQEAKYGTREKARRPEWAEDDEEEEEYHENDKEEFHRLDAEIRSTYILNQGSTVGYYDQGAKLDPVPSRMKPKKASNTDFSMPEASDPEFDKWLCEASETDILNFDDDERCEAKFRKISAALDRFKKRPFATAIKAAKDASGKVSEQQFYGKPGLLTIEIKILTNNSARLVMIGLEGKFVNYCIKTPKF